MDATTTNNCHPTHHDVVALCCTFVADNLDDVYSGFLGLVSAGPAGPSFYACILTVQTYCHDKPRYSRIPSSHNTKHGSLFGQQVAHLQCMPDGCRLVQDLDTSLSNLLQCIQHILKYHHCRRFLPVFLRQRINAKIQAVAQFQHWDHCRHAEDASAFHMGVYFLGDPAASSTKVTFSKRTTTAFSRSPTYIPTFSSASTRA